MSELTPITIDESKRLIALETVIQRGLSNFIEVGNALLEIREGRLYKSEHSTFDTYCVNRWGMKRAYADRLIGSAEVVENLTPIGVTPQTESQARPLTQLETAEQQQEAWSAAVEKTGGKPTAKDVQAAVEEVKAKRPFAEPALTEQEQERVVEAGKDSGVLWSLKSYWRRASKKERAAFREWLTNN